MKKIQRLIVSRWFLVPVFWGMVLLIILNTQKLNTKIFIYFNGMSSFGGSYLWANLTVLGDTLVAAVLILPLIKKHKDLVWALLLAGIISLFLSHLLKDLLNVLRPPAVFPAHLINVIGPIYKHKSFPSGHATTIFTIVSLLIFSSENTEIRWFYLVISLIIGFSRVVVGVHWPTDIIGGFLIGWISAFTGFLIYNSYSEKFPAINSKIINGLTLISAFYLLFLHNLQYEHTALFKSVISIYAFSDALIVFLLQYLQNHNFHAKQKKLMLRIVKLLFFIERHGA